MNFEDFEKSFYQLKLPWRDCNALVNDFRSTWINFLQPRAVLLDIGEENQIAFGIDVCKKCVLGDVRPEVQNPLEAVVARFDAEQLWNQSDEAASGFS